MKQRKRPSWDSYFMNIARVVATRGNCIRRKIGAVIIKDHRIVCTGYNGTPRGIKNCSEGGCKRCSGNLRSGEALTECICCHAEENAITQASYHGISLKDTTLYSTMSPCLLCAKMIINAGIREVVYAEKYEFSQQTADLFKKAGVKIRQLCMIENI